MTRPNNALAQLHTTQVPQFDSLDRLMAAVAMAASDAGLSESTFDLSDRHINYAKQAARVLGLLTDDSDVSSIGRRALRLRGAAQRRFLGTQFAKSPCGLAWVRNQRVQTIAELNPESADAFLRSAGLSESMAKRRGRTLQRWLRDFNSSNVREHLRGQS